MAVSKTFTGLKYMEIPYSDFSWDAGNACYKKENFTPPFATTLGYIVTATNGSAMMNAFYSSSNSRLYVNGWIPKNAENITSDYRFKCYAIGY